MLKLLMSLEDATAQRESIMLKDKYSVTKTEL